MSANQVRQLIKLLRQESLIDERQETALLNQDLPDLDEAEKVLRRDVYIAHEKWTELKAKVLGLPYVNLAEVVIGAPTLNVIPQDLAENYQVVVFGKDSHSMKVGLVNPGNFKAMEAIEYIARKSGQKVNYYLISQDSLRAAVKQYATFGEEVGEAMDIAETVFKPPEELEELSPKRPLEDVIKSAPVTKIISVIIRHAIEGRASDIHIEPVGDQSKVRYRIDGVLHTTIVLPIYVHAALVSRIKVMANLKLDETRMPQDGRIRLKVNRRDVDFRISVLPLVQTEKVVMRILTTPDKAPTLEDLGFMGLQKKVAEGNIRKSNGMYLVTGPTGSGKSTTLFSILDTLNSDAINIMTLEDPVEYFVAGVNQSQVHPEVGYTFASGLRSLLRQDPDIVMVGEIRDNDTAALSIHASLTGHFVLSTLHTNGALGAIPRLFDMQVEPFLLSSTLNVVIAQRLVRKICADCKGPHQLPDNVLATVTQQLAKIPEAAYYGGFKKGDPLQFYKGQGCTRCGATGYKGRVAIVETVEISKRMRELIAGGFQTSEVEKELVKQNFISMQLDGLIKSLLGITTIEEIMRVSESDL